MVEFVSSYVAGCSNSAACQALVSTVIISIIPLFPFVFLGQIIQTQPNILRAMLAFAAGALLSEVGHHILPEAFELEKTLNKIDIKSGHGHYHSNIWIYTASGIILFYLIESLLKLCSSHNHDDHESSNREIAYLGLISDFIHNFTDGVALAVSYSISRDLGISTTFSIIIHELPHELTDLSILVKSGIKFSTALRLQVLTASGGLLGCLIVSAAGDLSTQSKISLLSATAGGFIYIVMSGILPELKNGVNSLKSIIMDSIFIYFGLASGSYFDGNH